MALHFASGQFLSDYSNNVNNATQYAQWANYFMDYLKPRRNVLAWGLAWSVTPPADMSMQAMTWRDAYRQFDTYSRAASPNARIMGLIGTYLAMPLPTNNAIIARGSQYLWDWQAAQRSVKGMRNLLTGAFGYTKDPDIYMMHLYHPNSFDLSAALSALVAGPYDPNFGLNPDSNRIFVNEFATSSSVKEPWVPAQETVKGNDIQAFGDDNTPTLTPTGQSQWVGCALSVFSGVGVQKFAHWSLYDPYTMWSAAPWNKVGHDLAWNGYWGLKYEREADGNKPAYSTLTSFYQGGSAGCPTAPITTLKVDNSYYTTGQPAGLIWTAANTAIWEVNPPQVAPSYDCQSGANFSSNPGGSCAYTFTAGATVTGTQTYTFTAKAAGGLPLTPATATSTIVGAPLVYIITNEYGSTVLSQYNMIVVTGNAFSRFGGNTLQFTRSGYNDVWMYSGDGSGFPFQEWSYTQISAMLGGRLAPGQWQLYVRNGYASGPVGPITININ
ncbi:MAG: hypothetical protein JST93_27020 [Acidobacteria bacterium]|nr:hypothetical protein [Acidobacteriota bacterium]